MAGHATAPKDLGCHASSLSDSCNVHPACLAARGRAAAVGDRAETNHASKLQKIMVRFGAKLMRNGAKQCEMEISSKITKFGCIQSRFGCIQFPFCRGMAL